MADTLHTYEPALPYTEVEDLRRDMRELRATVAGMRAQVASLAARAGQILGADS